VPTQDENVTVTGDFGSGTGPFPFPALLSLDDDDPPQPASTAAASTKDVPTLNDLLTTRRFTDQLLARLQGFNKSAPTRCKSFGC
jgi:hypothetical protein